MEVRRISFYTQFECAKSDCPDTCCRGWRIPIDPATHRLYQKQTGTLKRKLFFSIKKHKGISSFDASFSPCPFLGRDHLCSLQKEYGDSYMPSICQCYPRNRKNYGSFALEYLELSCPQAAKLFLQHYNKYQICVSEEPVSYQRTGTNDDFSFLLRLSDSQKYLLDYLKQNASPLPQKFYTIACYARKLQNHYLTSSMNADYRVEDHHSSQSIFLPMTAIDGLITSLYHPKLKKSSPFFYQLCRIYFKEFDSLTAEIADSHYQDLCFSLRKTNNTIDTLLTTYYGYYIECCFYQIFENYSFLKTITKGMIHVWILELFFALYYHKHQSLSLEEQVRILSTYEKRARHNEDIANQMYELVYPYLPNT